MVTVGISLAGLLLFPTCERGPTARLAKLEAAVTFEARYLPLRDWAASISRDTGLRVTVSRALSERKITILCQRRPASEVMHEVAVALGLKWVQGKDNSLRAELDDSVRIAEREADQYEEAARLARLQKALKYAIDRGDMTPEQSHAEVTRVYKHLQELRQSRRAPDDAELLAAQDDYRLATTDPVHFQFLAAVAGKEPKALEALASGQPAFASTDATDRIAVLPKSILPFLSGDNDGVMFGYLDHAADGLRLEGKLFSTGGGGGYARLGTPLPMVEQPNPPKLRKWFNEWSSVQSAIVLAKPVADPEGVFESANYAHDGYDAIVSSTADQLVDLAKRSGVPVVADAFRRPSYRRAAIKSKTVSDWIEAFNRPRIENDIDFTPGFMRESEGWLMFRHDRYWVKQALEIPEEVIAHMAVRPTKGIDDYAWMASQLTWRQLAGARQNVLLPFSSSPLRSCGRLLLFWALLSSDQRSAVRSERLVLATINSEQVRALAIAMLDVQPSDTKSYVEILRHLVRNEPVFGGAFLQLTDPGYGKPKATRQPLNTQPLFKLGFGEHCAITWTIPSVVR